MPITDENATSVNRGLAGAALDEPQMTEKELNAKAAEYLAGTTGEDPEPKEQRRGRREDRGQSRDDDRGRRSQRRAARDNDGDGDLEDEDDTLEDDDDLDASFDDERDGDEDDFDAEDGFDDDDDDDLDEDDEDDDLEMRRRRRDDRDEDRGDRKTRRRYEAVRDIVRNFRDVTSRATLPGAGPQRDAAGSSRRDSAPSDEGSDDEALLKEIDEWKPEAGKLFRKLEKRLDSIRAEYQQAEGRRFIREMNHAGRQIARSLGLEKVYGRDSRTATANQQRAMAVLMHEAHKYASQIGRPIEDEEALKHAMLSLNWAKVKKHLNGKAERRVERSVRRRARSLDLVTERGGGGRDRGGSDQSDERSALRIAAEYQRANGIGRGRSRRAG